MMHHTVQVQKLELEKGTDLPPAMATYSSSPSLPLTRGVSTNDGQTAWTLTLLSSPR